MTTQRILAIIGLALIITGFCLPWLDFYGHLSGIDVLRIGWNLFNKNQDGLVPWLLFLIFIPICSAFSVMLIILWSHRLLMIATQIITIDLLAVFAYWFILGFISWKEIMYGYATMVSGIAIINALTVYMFIRRDKFIS